MSAVFIGVLILYFLPSEIFIANTIEFIAPKSVLMTNLVIGALILAIVLMLPVVIPFAMWKKIYTALLGGTFLALWISGVFMVGDFGEMDGSSFDLDRHTSTLLIHSVIFISVLLVGCMAVWKWPRHMSRAINVIGIGLLIIATFNFYNADSKASSAWEAVDLDDLSRFSTDQNLLIFIMDSFQSDALNGIIERDSSMREKLDGFRFYPDTLGVAPTTYLTMPAFHSGKNYNNMMTLSEYYDLGVRKGSFLAELAENGYQVDLINPINRTCPAGVNICQPQEKLLLHAREATNNETYRLADLGLLRVAPGLMKKWVFEESSGPITRSLKKLALTGSALLTYHGNDILKMMADNLWMDATAPSAKLIHLFNTHPPYIFDSKCNFTGVKNPQNRANMTMQIDCAMRWFVYLLDKMKRQGVYDNTMIILTADTGAGIFHADDDLSSLYAQEHGLEAGKFGRVIGGANPVLAIKFPETHGEIESSSISAQLTDIPRTVCEALKDCTKKEGINLRQEANPERTRYYNYYVWKHEYWSLGYIPGIVHYAVDGPLWFESSWSEKPPAEMPSLISTVHFSGEDDQDIFGSGWGHAEVNKKGVTKRWSIAKQAELFLPLPGSKQLTLDFKVLMAPDLSEQPMTVKVNGEVIGSRDLDHRIQSVSVTVPAGLVTEPVSTVTLGFSRLKLPDDPRHRKISVSFYELNVYQAGEQFGD